MTARDRRDFLAFALPIPGMHRGVSRSNPRASLQHSSRFTVDGAASPVDNHARLRWRGLGLLVLAALVHPAQSWAQLVRESVGGGVPGIEQPFRRAERRRRSSTATSSSSSWSARRSPSRCSRSASRRPRPTAPSASCSPRSSRRFRRRASCTESTVAAVGPGGTARSARSNTFQFSAPCTFAVSPTARTLTAAAGTSTTGVTAGAGCAWTATSNAAWLTCQRRRQRHRERHGHLQRHGEHVDRAAGRHADRRGPDGHRHADRRRLHLRRLTHLAHADFSRGGVHHGGHRGTGCAWTATSNATWLTVSGGASGIGNGTVTFNATTNTSTAQRTGTLTVAGQTVTVTQSGSSCTFTISPTSRRSLPPAAPRTTARHRGFGLRLDGHEQRRLADVHSAAPAAPAMRRDVSAPRRTPAPAARRHADVAGRTLTVTQSAGSGEAVAPTAPGGLRFVPTSP